MLLYLKQRFCSRDRIVIFDDETVIINSVGVKFSFFDLPGVGTSLLSYITDMYSTFPSSVFKL